MKKRLYQFVFFNLMGWKIEGTIDQSIQKCVMIVVPHTSWHDFYLGIFTRAILRLEMNFVAKKELFRFPFGFYFKWMGGAALDRTGGLNRVEAIAKLFEQRKTFRLAIAPEGTRKKVTEWKKGFYYIAHKANVPIVLAYLDYKKKEAGVKAVFYPTGNTEEDIETIRSYYRGVQGRNAENFAEK